MKQGVNSLAKNIQSRTYDNFKLQHKIYIIFLQFKKKKKIGFVLTHVGGAWKDTDKTQLTYTKHELQFRLVTVTVAQIRDDETKKPGN